MTARAENATVKRPPRAGGKRRVALALQGGGAHGAFTWGALDRLFEREDLEVAALCGASAGAMNAVVAAHGLVEDGPRGARRALADFWGSIGESAAFGPLQQTPFDRALGGGNLDFSLGYVVFDNLSRLFSPYQFNPFGINPIGPALERAVAFEKLQDADRAHLFVCATNVRSGRLQIFDNRSASAMPNVSRDAVLASACLPNLFHAVEIDGEHYWDGGFMGNPPLFPLIENTDVTDIIVVHINPIRRSSVPIAAPEIFDRMNELSFNSSLLREMREIDFVTNLIADGRIQNPRFREVYLHSILADGALDDLTASSKLNADPAFLARLYEVGRASADAFLEAHATDIGFCRTCGMARATNKFGA